jgi:hypothetical protein
MYLRLNLTKAWNTFGFIFSQETEKRPGFFLQKAS